MKVSTKFGRRGKPRSKPRVITSKPSLPSHAVSLKPITKEDIVDGKQCLVKIDDTWHAGTFETLTGYSVASGQYFSSLNFIGSHMTHSGGYSLDSIDAIFTIEE